jgi:hypothetical protein
VCVCVCVMFALYLYVHAHTSLCTCVIHTHLSPTVFLLLRKRAKKSTLTLTLLLLLLPKVNPNRGTTFFQSHPSTHTTRNRTEEGAPAQRQLLSNTAQSSCKYVTHTYTMYFTYRYIKCHMILTNRSYNITQSVSIPWNSILVDYTSVDGGK